MGILSLIRFQGACVAVVVAGKRVARMMRRLVFLLIGLCAAAVMASEMADLSAADAPVVARAVKQHGEDGPKPLEASDFPRYDAETKRRSQEINPTPTPTPTPYSSASTAPKAKPKPAYSSSTPAGKKKPPSKRKGKK